jgi:tetratricopeptide (TPR) repeat protein
LHRSGRLEEAVAQYEACVRAHPDWVEPRSNLGAALAGLGRYGQAAKQYTEVLRKHPEHGAVRLNLALAYYKSARIPEAISELKQLRASNPANRKIALLLADCYFRTGEEARVVEILEPLGAATPDDRAVAYLLGTALIRSGQIARGEVWVNHLLASGESAEALLMLGLAKLERKQYEEAAPDLRRALALNPSVPGGHALLGLALAGMNDREGARKEFEAELARDPNDFESHFQLALLDKEEQKLAEALERFRRARQLRPKSLKVSYQIAVALLGLGRNDEATAELESLLAQSPDFAEGHASLALAYYRLKRKADGDRHRAIERRLRRSGKTP